MSKYILFIYVGAFNFTIISDVYRSFIWNNIY